VFQQKVLTVLQVGQFFPHNGYEGRHAGWLYKYIYGLLQEGK
jgi:hypothetical protein